MTTIRVDKRRIRFERDDEALREVEVLQPEWLALELRLARLFARIDRKSAFLPTTSASVGEYAARQGYDGFRARDLMHVGYALGGVPGLEDALRNREVSFQAAAEIGRLHRDTGLLEEDDDWLKVARLTRLRDLKRRVRKRIESVRQGRKTVQQFTAMISADTAEDLERCRKIASRKAKLSLTRGQTLVVLSTSYLDAHDLLAKKPGTRRMRPTSERPADRSVPRAVARAIEERSGGLCEFGSCDRSSTELCHLTPHREGSAREVEDLAGGCRSHHKAYDAGMLRFLGWTNDALPCFLSTDTNEILEPKPRPEARDPAVKPEWLLRAIGRRSRKKAPREAAASGKAAVDSRPPDGPSLPSPRNCPLAHVPGNPARTRWYLRKRTG